MKFLIMAVVLIASSLVSLQTANAAPAAIASIFSLQNTPNDASVCALEEILGPQIVGAVVTPPSTCVQYGSQAVMSGVQSALAAGFNIYASACFALMGLIFSWWWLVALISAGSTGQAGNAKVNPVWAPVRMSLGMIMLGPTGPTVGFCSVQFVVLYLAIQGIGVADYTMNAMLSAFSMGVGAPGPSSKAILKVMGFDADMALMLACKEYFEQEGLAVSTANSSATYYKVAEDYRPKNVPPPASYPGPTSGSPSGGGGTSGQIGDIYTLNFDIYSSNGNLVEPSGCGAIDISAESQLPSTLSNQALVTFSNQMSSSVATTESTYVNSMLTTLDPLAKQFIETVTNASQSGSGSGAGLTQSQITSAMSAAASAVETLHSTETGALYNAAVTYINDLNGNVVGTSSGNMWTAISTDLTTNGWAHIGDYFYEMVTAQRIMAAAVDSVPVMDIPPHAWTGLPAQVSSELTDALNAFTKSLTEYSLTSGSSSGPSMTSIAGGSPTSGPASYSTATGIGGGLSGILLGGLVNEFQSSASSSASTSTGNPQNDTGGVNAVIRIGNLFEDWGEVVLAISVGSRIFSGAPGGGITKKFLSFLGEDPAIVIIKKVLGPLKKFLSSDMMRDLGVILLVLGLSLNTILPFMPSIIWIIVYVGWIVLVLEALLAGPMWAVAHSLPEGEGIAGANARRGYMILLNVVFRPVLSVFGFFASIAMIDIALGIVLESYIRVASTVININKFAIFDFLAITAAYVYLALMVVIKSAELVSIIPTKIMSWIGGDGGDGINSQGVIQQSLSNVKTLGSRTAAALMGRSQPTQTTAPQNTQITAGHGGGPPIQG